MPGRDRGFRRQRGRSVDGGPADRQDPPALRPRAGRSGGRPRHGGERPHPRGAGSGGFGLDLRAEVDRHPEAGEGAAGGGRPDPGRGRRDRQPGLPRRAADGLLQSPAPRRAPAQARRIAPSHGKPARGDRADRPKARVAPARQGGHRPARRRGRRPPQGLQALRDL